MTFREETHQEETYGVWIKRDLKTGVAVLEAWSAKDPSKGLWPDYHRIGAPASIARDPTTGVVLEEEWYRYGKLHREDGPAIIRRAPDGKVKYTSWYQNGELIPYRNRPKAAREAKPAVLVK
jgi:hypothetical protein